MLLLQLIILFIIFFGGLVIFLRYLLSRNITSATAHLESMNAQFIRREEEIKNRHTEADQYYSQTVDKARQEAEAVRQTTLAQTESDKERILEEARAQSEQIIAKAEKTRAMIVSELKKDVETRMIGHLRGVIEKAFPENIRKEIHRLWLSDLLVGPLSEIKTMSIDCSQQDVRVTSAFVLEEADRRSLQNKIKDQLGWDLVIHEDVDSSLIAGIVVRFGSLVLDGSVFSKMEQILDERFQSA